MPDEAPPQHPSTVTAYNPDGTPIELPAQAAQTAFQAHRIGFANTDKVNVRLADGRIGTVPGASLAGALQQGAQMISPEEARAHELAKQYSGVGGGVAALGLGALRGGTFGLSDVAGKALLGEDYTELAEGAKAAHPTLSGVGEAGGMIGLGALTGGSSALEELGAGAFGEGMLGKIATHALSGGVEGAYLGGADAISEDALSGGNHALTAEKVFASMGENALYGTALGGLGGAIGGGLGKLMGRGAEGAEAGAKEIESLAEKKYGYVPEGLGDAAVKLQSALAGGGRDLIEEAGVQNQSRAAKAIRSDLLEIDQARDDAARDVTDHVNTLLKDGRDVADEAKGVLKRDQLAKSVSRENPLATAQHSATTISSLRTEIQSMIGDSEQFGQEKVLGRMNRELGRIEGKIADAAGNGDVASQFAELDDAKRAIGGWARDVKAVSMRGSSDATTLRQSRATYQKLDNLYEGLRGNLEDEGIWGRAATQQRAINEAWTEQIAADKRFKATLAAVTGEERFGGKVYSADPAKISRYVSSLTNPEQDLVHQTIQNYVKATQKLTSAIGDNFELQAGKVAAVERVKGAADAFDKTLQDIGPKLAKANQLKTLMANETGGNYALIGGLLGHAIAGPAGGALGAMAGRAVGVLSQPGRNMMRLAQIERMTSKLDRRIAKSAETFFERTRTGARILKKTASHTGSALDDIFLADHPAGEAAKEIAVEHGKETAKETIRERFEERSKQVADLQRSPTEAIDRMNPHVSEMASAAPKTAAALGAVTAKATAYLASIKPVAPPADPLTGKPGIPPASQQAEFVRNTDAVLRPQTVLDDLDKGRATSGQVAALHAVHPNMLEELRGIMRQAMVEHAASGGNIPYNKRVQMQTLLGVDPEPTTQPPAVNHAQATFAITPKPQQEKAPGDSKALALTDATKTPAQQLESPSP